MELWDSGIDAHQTTESQSVALRQPTTPSSNSGLAHSEAVRLGGYPLGLPPTYYENIEAPRVQAAFLGSRSLPRANSLIKQVGHEERPTPDSAVCDGLSSCRKFFIVIICNRGDGGVTSFGVSLIRKTD